MVMFKKLVDKIVDVVEVNQWSYLKQTLPWLENVNQIHLELSSVTKKVEVKCPFGFTNSRPLDHKIARLCFATGLQPLPKRHFCSDSSVGNI